jgi:hypothetical protein
MADFHGVLVKARKPARKAAKSRDIGGGRTIAATAATGRAQYVNIRLSGQRSRTTSRNPSACSSASAARSGVQNFKALTEELKRRNG